MRTLEYTYEVEGDCLFVDDLGGGRSVMQFIDQVLTEIQAEIGPLTGKYIIWRGDDAMWDLLLPVAVKDSQYTDMYPLGAATTLEATAALNELLTIKPGLGKLP